MDDIILSCAIVGDWRIFTIEVNSAETLASVKLKVHANGRSRITKFDEDHGDLMYLYRARERDEWMAEDHSFLAIKHSRWVPEDIEDVVCEENLLSEEDMSLSSFQRFPQNTLNLLIVYPINSDEVAVSIWTPPTVVIKTVAPIQVETIQAPAGCKCCEPKRSPILTTDVVTGVFVKLMRRQGEELTVERIQAKLPAESVTAISYTWGTLPHDQRVDFTNIKSELKLSTEWDTEKFVARLVLLSESHWLWIDQLCLPQDGELSMVLSTEIAEIYSSCRVCCLVATLPCDRFRALQEETAAIGDPEEYPDLVEQHMKECDCTVNWNVYFSRIWPWQEFAISTNIQFHLGLGQQNLISIGGIRSLLTAMNQVAVKLADRMWGGTADEMERNNREAAALLVLGWGVRAEPRKKISTFDTLMFMSWLARSQRTATKMLDCFFAVAPLLQLASDYQISSAMTVTEALVTLMNAFQNRHRLYLSGAVPTGLFGDSAQTYRMVLLELASFGDFIKSTYDLLPFVTTTAMPRTVQGVVRGYPAPRAISTLLLYGQSHRASLRTIVQSMSQLQKLQANEFMRGQLCDQLAPSYRAITGALAGLMDRLFSVGDIMVVQDDMEVAEYNSMLFRTVAVVLGFIPFHAVAFAVVMSNNAALACVEITDGEKALVMVNEASLTTHICISGDATYVGVLASDGKFRITGTVLGSFGLIKLSYELVQDLGYANSTVIA